MKKIDITGNKYGRLTVIKENGKQGKNIMWLCKCDCGCGTVIRKYDKCGRERKYVNGHNFRNK